MTQQRDIERLLDHWFSDGPEEAPDRVLDIVTDRIERRSQIPAWRLLWRSSPMNTYAKIAVAAAAILIVAVMGYTLLPGGSTGVGGPVPTPSATPTAIPSTSAATGPIALPEGALQSGRFSMKPFEDSPTLSIVADVPAGWQGAGGQVLVSPGETSNTGVMIAFMKTDGLFSDPCQWDLDGTGEGLRGDVEVGPTVDDLVAALKANKSYTSSAATPVTVGGFTGQELELQLPGDDVLATCDKAPGDENGTYYVFPRGFYAQSPDSRWRLFIIDVDGTRLITLIGSAPGVSQADLAAAQAIVESFAITP